MIQTMMALAFCSSFLISFFFSLSPNRFRRGFESEPTLHSGINYAVLLLAAGHQFDSSFELRKVGEEKQSPTHTNALVDNSRPFVYYS